jgi:hypothetical protein
VLLETMDTNSEEEQKAIENRTKIIKSLMSNHKIEGISDWAKKIKKMCSEKLEEYNDGQNNQIIEKYKKLLGNSEETFEHYFYGYIKKGRKLGDEKLELIGESIGLTGKELKSILYPYLWKDFANIDSDNKNKSSEEKGEFSLPLILLTVKYTEKPTRALTIEKTYILKSLREGLASAVRLSHYKCVKNKEKKPDINVSGSVKYDLEENANKDENYITIIFDNSLAENEEIKFTITCTYTELEEDEVMFHNTWIRFPTDLLILIVIPPNIERDTLAKYYVCKKKDDYWDMIKEASIKYNENLNEILLAFHKVIPNPELDQTYGYCWLIKDGEDNKTD